ncbi:MAG: helix-turn-helix domain-containing protein [Anaerolineaceae bacterium]|jgi:transcriptional regulator with XRE-family HTH domain|nr:MAG: helix-turn-helix domain-containing protein [Anaerolineaceae bacterium]
MTNKSQSINVGDRIRSVRRNARLSQQELAKLSNISINTLSLLERGMTSPTIATLQKLADTLNVELSSFFLFSKIEQHVFFSKANKREPIHITEGYFFDLNPGSILPSFKPVEIQVNPEMTSSKMVKHEGYEFLYCLENELLVMISDLSYLLEKGDSIFFNASLPHHWQNKTHETTKIIMVQLTPDKNQKTNPGDSKHLIDK